MSLGLMGVESFEFYVADLARSRRFHVDLLDFREVARASEERRERIGHDSSVFRAGNIEVQVSQPLRANSDAARYLEWHPDGIPEVSFRVKNLEQAWKFLEERGGTFIADPEEHRKGDSSYRSFRIATALGDVLFRFVERNNWEGAAPGFNELVPADEGNRFGFELVDHITMNTLSLAPLINWFRDVLGMEQFWDVQFHTEDVRKGDSGSGLKSIVMHDGPSHVRFANNEPMKPFFDASQITQFVRDHRGPGIQHVAFTTPAIIPTVDGLRGRGVSFLSTPGSYYDALPKRFEEVGLSMSTIKEPMDQLRELGILVDGADERYMLQIFLQEGAGLYKDPKAGPFFYEIIQRAGDPGFGGGNFRALFESIERDQLARADAS